MFSYPTAFSKPVFCRRAAVVSAPQSVTACSVMATNSTSCALASDKASAWFFCWRCCFLGVVVLGVEGKVNRKTMRIMFFFFGFLF